MSLKIFLLYLMTWSLVALTPGPAVICSMTQATRHGFRSSLVGISGIQAGNFLFFVGIALGIGTLLATASTAFTILRILGAIYLLYLGVRMIAATIWRPASKPSQPSPPPTAHGSLFLQGLLIQVTNPKALLFVSALLPQFIDPHRSAPVQLAILVFTTIVVDFVVLSLYAFFAQRGVASFRASRFSRWLERAFGATLVFFGARLLFSRN
jgi:homoserine/homoserine lactone efflux protein